jgi:nucleoside-diphosphate-sugar epimerase
MDVFVTGGSGFLGQHLLRALTAGGHRVRALVRSRTAAETVTAAGAEAIRGDVTDGEALRGGMDGCDVAVHAAAYTKQWGPRQRFHEVNVVGTEAVLEAARASTVARLVHVSTEAVLADGHPLVCVDETCPRPRHPVGEYARTKTAAEKLVLATNGAELATIVVRPRLMWGPGDTTILPAVVQAAASGRFRWIDGGRYLTSTCHVINACEGIEFAAERGRGGEVYFLTDGAPVQFRSFLSALAATAGVELDDRSVPRTLAWAGAVVVEQAWRLLRLSGEPPITRTFLALSAQEMTVDDTKARRHFGYRGTVSREQGLSDLAKVGPPRPSRKR